MNTSEFPGDVDGGRTEEIRDQLTILAARGKIKSTERFLKKASAKQLEKLMVEYDRQQTEVVDELVSKYVIGALSTLMMSMKYIDEEECEEMKKTLLDNDLVKRDLGDLSGYVTRNIRYIGIATMVAVAGGYAIAKRYGKQTDNGSDGPTPDEERQEGQ